jgi:hypothetical protein
MTQGTLQRRPPPAGGAATEVRVKQRKRRLLVGLRPCNTVKLRELPKASVTAARRKVGCSTRVMTSGMVTAQRMYQWIIRSQVLRAGGPAPGIGMQFND